MARPLRIEVADGVYHVTSRGLERREIVRDDRDREKWHELLATVAVRRRWRVFAWALLDNHHHLFLQTPEPNLSAGMHDLNSGYATVFNRRHGRYGPLLQGRFKAILVERDAHDWELSRYVHLNPVRAGLAARPELYPWSSCRFYLGLASPPPWLAWEQVLIRHGRRLREARRAYAAFLDEGVATPPRSPLGRVVASTVLGSAAFVEKVKAWLAGRRPDPEVPAARALAPRVEPEDAEAAVCRAFGVEAAVLRQRGRWHNEPRSVAIYLCRKWTGGTIRAIGERFGGVLGTQVTKCAAAVAAQLTRDRSLAEKVRQCEHALAKKEKSKT
ncbi:MAG: hypothetical protein FJ290_31550 [Planctomycetes bacterium]|nr:hypothetical protein [Planctomycetota bacterium]